MRLTRRGRLVLLLALIVLGLGSFSLGRVASSAASSAAAPPAARQTVVRAGDTLWMVARRALPQQDPRRVVLMLQSLNDLHDVSLRPGQQLILPA